MAVFFHVPRFAITPLPRPELRRDPVLERWVIISTDRLGRPHELQAQEAPQSLAACPFCAGHEHLTPPATYVEPAAGRWSVRVVPNVFPAARGEGLTTSNEWLTPSLARGEHEVIIACPQHEGSLARLSADHLAAVFRSFRERINDLRRRRPELYPFIFNNHRAAAGASLEHAHAQLIALPMTPDLVAREIEAGARHFRDSGKCIYCELLARELALKARVVQESPRFIALSAFAARFPCELWLLPRQHASHFDRIGDDALEELGAVVRTLLRKLDRGLDDPAYNMILHTSPPRDPASPAYHWHVEILPRLTGAAGFEWGTGMNINPVPPEQAAAYLRAVEVD